MNNRVINLSNEKLYQDACKIIEQAQVAAYRAVNETLIKRNWLLGMRIQHEVLKDKRAEYGEQVMVNLANKLTKRYGEGFIKRNLHHFVDFYLKHTDIFQILQVKSEIVNALSSQSQIIPSTTGQYDNILHALSAKSPIKLSWTHYRIILQENNKEARDWYEQEAAREMWSTRTLQREDYYIDLVFYNYNLRCFVLIDLKTTKLCHQDVGQMDMYVRMYDEMMCPQGHNPTIGILLCADTDEDVAHYSVLYDNNNLYAAKYLTYMPTKEELRREIEQQKEFFRLQNKDS